MDLKNFFNKVKDELAPKEPHHSLSNDKLNIKHAPKVESQSHWIKCPACESMLFFKEVEHLNHICPKCNFHMRIGANKRIQLLADENSFIEHDSELHPNDPLNFVDSKTYQSRLDDAFAATGKRSSIISGSCTIDGAPVELVIFDFAFLGGSLGSV